MTPTVEGRPTFAPEAVENAVRELYGLEGTAVPLPAEWDQNFRLHVAGRPAFVVKLANAGTSSAELDLQDAALDWLARYWSSGLAPRVIASLSGEKICSVSAAGDSSFRMRVVTYQPGEPLASLSSLSTETLARLGRLLGDLDRCLADFTHPAMERMIGWDVRRAEWISSSTRTIGDVARRGIVERLLLQFRARVAPLLSGIPHSVIHNDANDDNVLVAPDGNGGWRIAGLLDFGDMLKTCTVCEPAIAAAYAALRAADPLAAAATIAAGYHAQRHLTEREIAVLFPLIVMRLCISVTTSALAAEEDPENRHRQVSDRLAWAALERLEPVDWTEAEQTLRRACGVDVPPRSSPKDREHRYRETLKGRRQRIGPSLTLAYDTPLEIVRGSGQFLFEPDGRAYLDCVNNVCHVGHCHPRVVRELTGQAEILNTNTRYLHPLIVEYAKRLTATLPEPLRVCYFANSGSEANDLAVRIARTSTGRSDVIVMDGAYHGNTQTLVDLSPYKCEGPGGQGLAPWAHKVPRPDPYRGSHRGTGEDAGHAYAEQVRQVCEDLRVEGHPPALFLCEPILGCAGQVVLPDGYLRESFRHVRAVGGLCMVDEVQVGLGRVGTHMWAFQTQDVVPDIVTLGKPIGNGHPLAAVITTEDIARSFANGMEYFSSFGGNPVSIAVGMAVLDVLEEEGLQDQARRVGEYLLDGFRAMGRRHPQIGDVRGQGLFIGVELVEESRDRAPARDLTTWLIERVKADGVLLSAEGPHHNVLKIKPPMVFAETDADLLLGAVDRALTAAP